MPNMPSHLTRRVFSRLLANEPIVPRGCLRRQFRDPVRYSSRLARRPTLSDRHGASRSPTSQRRSFLDFNIFGNKKRHLKELDLEPGIDLMTSLAKRERMRARMPPPDEVAQALKSFFMYKWREQEDVQDYQAQLAFQSLRYLVAHLKEQDNSSGANGRGSLLPDEVLSRAAAALRIKADLHGEAHCELAKLIHDELLEANFKDQYRGVSAYVRVLSALGRASQARDVVNQFEARIKGGAVIGTSSDADMHEDSSEGLALEKSEESQLGSNHAAFASLWGLVLQAYAKAGSESEILAVLETVRSKGYDRTRRLPMTMLDFYLRQSNAEGIKKWFPECWAAQSSGVERQGKSGDFMGADLHRVLQWCLETKNLDFGHEAIRLAMTSNPPKQAWDAILVWAAGTGKGADEIDRMLGVMEASNRDLADEKDWRRPDIATINGLVAYATSKNDPYLAERFLAIAKKRGLEPDAWTYVLQMDYRLSVNDVDGALTAYNNLQAMDLSSNADVPTVNKLIVALCNGKRHSFDTVMNVVGDLADRQARFESQTVATLSILHLSRDEVHDVLDLLNTHAAHFSTSERDSIRNDILAFCLDAQTETVLAWDAYSVLRNTFDDLPRPERTEIMLSFFKRQRPDMAVHVFNHMRAHTREDTMPIRETYVSAFLGAGRIRDTDSLEVIHNQLKLDFNINVNTHLRNALLAAYTACSQPRRALTFWDEIVASKEGPSYNSLHIAFRACEKAPFGDLQAQKIWARLRKLRIDLDPSLWASYVAALAGNGDTPLAISTLEQAVLQDDLLVDAFLIASLFAGCSGQNQQAHVEEWAKTNYPAIWQELLDLGYNEEEDGMRAFHIDRSVSP